MDYTFCTLRLDARSVGGILTRALGDVLTKAGYTHWYWGFALRYMRDYDSYGGAEVSRGEFYRTLQASTQTPAGPVADVIEGGRALIAPRRRPIALTP
jgi:hypothetical protein